MAASPYGCDKVIEEIHEPWFRTLAAASGGRVGDGAAADERIGPELRQYIVTDNDQERPFSRDQRRWVYTSSKTTDRTFGFGTDNDLERVHNYVIVKHAGARYVVVTTGDGIGEDLA